MIRTVLVLLALGCAAQKPAQVARNQNQNEKGVQRCHMEQDTGSNRMYRVCTTEKPGAPAAGDTGVDDAMIQMERRAAQHVSPGM